MGVLDSYTASHVNITGLRFTTRPSQTRASRFWNFAVLNTHIIEASVLRTVVKRTAFFRSLTRGQWGVSSFKQDATTVSIKNVDPISVDHHSPVDHVLERTSVEILWPSWFQHLISGVNSIYRATVDEFSRSALNAWRTAI